MSYPTVGPFKRGDTLNLTCKYKPDGVLTSVESMDIASQLRTQSGTLILDFVVTKADQTTLPGVFYLEPLDQTITKTFPYNESLITDIQITNNQIIVSTETFAISVVKDQTYD